MEASCTGQVASHSGSTSSRQDLKNELELHRTLIRISQNLQRKGWSAIEYAAELFADAIGSNCMAVYIRQGGGGMEKGVEFADLADGPCLPDFYSEAQHSKTCWAGAFSDGIGVKLSENDLEEGKRWGPLVPERAQETILFPIVCDGNTEGAVVLHRFPVSGQNVVPFKEWAYGAVRMFASVVASCHEAATRKRVSENLRAQNSLLESGISALETGVLVASSGHVAESQGEFGGKVLYSNEAFDESIGERARGKRVSDLRYMAENKERFCRFLDVINRRTEFSGIARIRKDGEARVYRVEITPFKDADGHVLYWIVTHAEITDQVKNERHLLDSIHRAQREIGRELHDDLGQEMVTLVHHADEMLEEIEGLDNGAGAVEKGESLVDKAQDCIRQIRRLAHGMDPIDLGSTEFSETLRGLLGDFARSSSCDVSFTNGLAEEGASQMKGFTDAQKKDIYRVVQQALANAIVHGQPDTITASVSEIGNAIQIVVEDDGRGPGPDFKEGFGIKSMRQRARVLGGQLECGPRPQGGFCVRLVV